MGWESSDVIRFDLGPLLQGQTRIAKMKSAYNLLIIGTGVLGCETDLQEIMGWESTDAARFDLRPLLQGQRRIAKLKSVFNSPVIGPRGLGCEPTYRKSREGSLLMWSDLTLGPFFKVKGG